MASGGIDVHTKALIHSRECRKKPLGLPEVSGIKALREPAVNVCQQRVGCGTLTLPLP